MQGLRNLQGVQMAVRGTAELETAPSANGSTILVPRAGTIVGRWAKYRRQLLTVLILISSDVLLALAVWQAAFMLQAILGRGSLSEITVASALPNIIVWVGLRASLGLYPGRGLGQ